MLQIISQTPNRAEVVLKMGGDSHTIHVQRVGVSRFYTDKRGQSYDLAQPEPTDRFLAEWYGRRAADAIRRWDDRSYALARTALRYAIQAMPIAA